MAQHGGRRPGAGRKKGSHDKFAIEAARKAAEEGIMPLDYMLKVMRDSEETRNVRLDAAKAAAPYVHAKLSAVTVDGKLDGEQTVVVADAERIRAAADAFDRLAASIGGRGNGAGSVSLPH